MAQTVQAHALGLGLVVVAIVAGSRLTMGAIEQLVRCGRDLSVDAYQECPEAPVLGIVLEVREQLVRRAEPLDVLHRHIRGVHHLLGLGKGWVERMVVALVWLVGRSM